MRTHEMISKLHVGQYAECINAPNRPQYSTLDYCVEKNEEGGISWCGGKGDYLMMAPFILERAEWVIIANKSEAADE